jgi:hypothetical protein
MRNQPQQTGKPKYSAHSYNTISVVSHRHEKESYTENHKQSVHVAPSIGKEIFRTNCNYANHQLHNKNPNKYRIKGFD